MAEKEGGGDEPAMKRSRTEQVGGVCQDQVDANHHQAGEQGRRGRGETQQGNEQGMSSPMAQDKNLDYLCPICFELITEVDCHSKSTSIHFLLLLRHT